MTVKDKEKFNNSLKEMPFLYWFFTHCNEPISHASISKKVDKYNNLLNYLIAKLDDLDVIVSKY